MHNLLLTDRQVLSLYKAFASNSSTNVNLVLNTFQKKWKFLLATKVSLEISTECRPMIQQCVDTFSLDLLILCSKSKVWQIS